MTIVVITETKTEKDLAAFFPAQGNDGTQRNDRTPENDRVQGGGRAMGDDGAPGGDRTRESDRVQRNKWILVRTAAAAEACPGADVYIDLDFVNEPGRVEILNRLLPGLVLVNAVVTTLEEIASPFVRINGWPGFLERTIHELAVLKELSADKLAALKDQLTALYEKLGRDYRFVPDTPGMISGRILATIINEAYYTWEEEVSTREEIDIAMKLGTNYPLGPFEWGREIGLEKIAGLLTALSRNNGRYTPAKSLLQAANC